MYDYINDYFVPVIWSDQILPLVTFCLHPPPPPPPPLFFSNRLNGNYAILIKSMLLFSQGCLDLDVSGPINAIKQIILRQYFPDENNATAKTSIFDCVAECFTKTNYFIYYVSLLTIVVMWISFNKTSVRII